MNGLLVVVLQRNGGWFISYAQNLCTYSTQLTPDDLSDLDLPLFAPPSLLPPWSEAVKSTAIALLTEDASSLP